MESIGWHYADVDALTEAVGWKSSHTFKGQDHATGHGFYKAWKNKPKISLCE